MFYNFKIPLILFLSSFVLLILWMAFKISHWAGQNLLFGIMLTMQAFALVWLTLIIVKPKQRK
jgi:hypothetical protein